MIQPTQERIAGRRLLTPGVLLATLMAWYLLVAAAPAHAATFTVDRNDDPDPNTAKACTDAPDDCSLRGAVVAANTAAGPDAVTVPAGTYALTREGDFEEAASTGDLDIADELTITGAGARTTSVVGGAAPFDDRIFDNHSGATTISGLTITGGETGAYEGGGVKNEGDLTLDGVAIKDNAAGRGGGIDSRGDLTLDGVAVKSNIANSNGGIYSENGMLNITNSTVSDNSAVESFGGGVVHYNGAANITNSTISGNKSARFGGGVLAASASINIRNSTIASNESGGLGGGILTVGPGSLVVVKNTIVADNTFDNCDTAQISGGIIRSQGNNISSDGSCGFTTPADKQNINPRVGPLQDNGGPTYTRALLAGSPAIDAGTNTGCPATDQRGVVRPQGPRCDVGAFERRNGPPVARNDSFRGKEDSALSRSAPGILANDKDPDGDALRARIVSGPSKGTLSLKANGSFSYKPPRDFNGTVRFVYRASDGRGGTDAATVNIRLEARPA